MNRERLTVLFEEIGSLQRNISEHGMPLSQGRERIHDCVLEVVLLLPPDNQHIWRDLLQWIMYEWGQAQSRNGDVASEPWREFLGEISDLVGPIPD